jgi:transcriptional regulator with PAS, ATPase and Fis domain
VGGETNIPVNARLIAATNRDLAEEVEAGRFRSDLFYRLNVLSITVPPLRERSEDLPLLVRSIVEQVTSEMQLPHSPVVDTAGLKALSAYHWPGNVRELRNVLERSLILSGKGRISLGSLGLGAANQGEWSFSAGFPEKGDINAALDDFRRALIHEALARTKGNKQAAADLLGISRFALFRLMKSTAVSEQ